MNNREFRPTLENDIVTPQGESIAKKRKEKRDFLAEKLKEKRRESKLLLDKSTSFVSKVKNLFGKEKSSTELRLESEAIKSDMTRQKDIAKNRINRELETSVHTTLEETINTPLYELQGLYANHGKLYGHGTEEEKLDFRIGEEKLKQKFNFSNFKTASENPQLREEILQPLFGLYKSPFLNAGIEGSQYTATASEQLTGLPIDIAETFLKGLVVEYQKNKKNTSDAKDEKEKKMIETNDKGAIFKLIDKMYPLARLRINPSEKAALIEYIKNTIMTLNSHEFDTLGAVIDFGLENDPDGSFMKNIQSRIDTDIKEGNFGSPGNFCSSRNEILRLYAHAAIKRSLLDTFKIDGEEMIKAWQDGWAHVTNEFDANILAMKKLEQLRPGAAKELFERFNIKEFSRYPEEILIDQYDQRNLDIPYGSVMYTNDDSNSAFDQDTSTLRDIYNQTKGRVAMRISEFSSRAGLVRQLIKLNKTYGEKHKLEYLIIGAHGDKGSFDPGGSHDVTSEDLGGVGAGRLKDFFIDKPNIVLFSCSTGEVGGIGQVASSVYGSKVVAPQVPAAVIKTDVHFDEKGHPQFAVEFQNKYNLPLPHGSEVAQYYNSGESL